MKGYDRIFGIGPAGLIISLILLALAFILKGRFHGLVIFKDIMPRIIILIIASCSAVAIIIWSFISLPVHERGKGVCNKGIYKYLRHPLYSAFLSMFNIGFALYLNNLIFIAWAILLHPLWNMLVISEEKLMINEYGDKYILYAEKTGRFIPKLKLLSG